MLFSPKIVIHPECSDSCSKRRKYFLSNPKIISSSVSLQRKSVRLRPQCLEVIAVFCIESSMSNFLFAYKPILHASPHSLESTSAKRKNLIFIGLLVQKRILAYKRYQKERKELKGFQLTRRCARRVFLTNNRCLV